MQQYIGQFIDFITNFVEGNNMFLSVFFGVFAIVLESIIPALPLALFIAINIIAFGNFWGFIISWLSTVAGCTLSFFICRKFRGFVERKFKNQEKVLGFINRVDEIKFSNLMLIIAMPFTPAFSINIAAGLSKMKYKKYLLALLISKTFIVYFWGYIGSTFLQNITDVDMLIQLGVIVAILFLISKMIMKKFDI
jgi:SNARE-like domain protein